MTRLDMASGRSGHDHGTAQTPDAAVGEHSYAPLSVEAGWVTRIAIHASKPVLERSCRQSGSPSHTRGHVVSSAVVKSHVLSSSGPSTSSRHEA